MTVKHSLAGPLSARPIGRRARVLRARRPFPGLCAVPFIRMSRATRATRASCAMRAMRPMHAKYAATARLLGLVPAAVALAALAFPVRADDEAPRNWANDPFLQLRADDPTCPEPRGPRMTATEWRAEAHWRIETGTSCWLAGRCADANAYRYDASIAQALFPRLQALPELAGSGVWAYLQRRILFVQGCVADRAQAQAIEAAIGRAAAAVPELTMVVPALRVAGDEGTPYRRLDGR